METNAMNQSLLGALDIGGTKIAASVANADGPLARVTAPTPKSGPPDTVARTCIELLHAACDQAGVPREPVEKREDGSLGGHVGRSLGVSGAERAGMKRRRRRRHPKARSGAGVAGKSHAGRLRRQ